MSKTRRVLGLAVLLAGVAHAALALDITGSYTGTSTDTHGNVAHLTATFSQSGTTVTGTLGVAGVSCLSSLSFSGMLTGSTLAGSFSDSTSRVDIEATVSETQVTGTFTVIMAPCATGNGTFTLTAMAAPTATQAVIPTPTPT